MIVKQSTRDALVVRGLEPQALSARSVDFALVSVAVEGRRQWGTGAVWGIRMGHYGAPVLVPQVPSGVVGRPVASGYSGARGEQRQGEHSEAAT